ncbi:hypothetical protein K458DRAFT_392919 [Lentithecium fluviatile CBS 122367]|uniref:Uncharacterized protein n=1 Tax=Lentithecium fluviatile CBS 122367 TaxID=1168545 RepID=A0A6G1IPU6_9PLEO|nr:hypothetical protein K458DRAFT_392919 [Lentithecium fluviatile CBS 122367]
MPHNLITPHFAPQPMPGYRSAPLCRIANLTQTSPNLRQTPSFKGTPVKAPGGSLIRLGWFGVGCVVFPAGVVVVAEEAVDGGPNGLGWADTRGLAKAHR